MSHVVQAIGLQDLPPARDFILSAGFAGVAAVVAAVIAAAAVFFASRRAGKRSLAEREQRERHHEERRADEQRAAAVERCWNRWWQVLETAAIEPAASEGATLGLGPEVALELLRGLLRDAEQLGDDTLAKAVAVYQEQLLLVLAQQSGPLSKLAVVPANGGPKKDSPPPDVVGSAPRRRPAAEVAGSADPEPATPVSNPAAAEETAGRRRRP